VSATTATSGHQAPRPSVIVEAKCAAWLGLASALAFAMAFPYFLAMLPKLASAKLPLGILVPVGALQTGGVAFGLAWAGLWFGGQLGLTMPFLRAAVMREHLRAPSHLLAAAAAGATVATLGALLDKYLLLPLQPDAIRLAGAAIAPWKGLMSSFYGGIVEEIQIRLFLMSALALVLRKFARLRVDTAIVIAIVLAALLFGLGHLPAAAQMARLSSIVVFRVVLLNMIVGLVCGVFFWRWGLEHAMLAHFAADIVFHVAFAG